MCDPQEFMWREQASGKQTLPFFAWLPIEQRTGETIWRLWLLSGWTSEYRSTSP